MRRGGVVFRPPRPVAAAFFYLHPPPSAAMPPKFDPNEIKVGTSRAAEGWMGCGAGSEGGPGPAERG